MAPVAQAVKHLHSRLQRGCRGAAVFHYQEVLRRGTVVVTRSGSSQIAAAARTIEAVADDSGDRDEEAPHRIASCWRGAAWSRVILRTRYNHACAR